MSWQSDAVAEASDRILKIGEVVDLTGVSARTLRYYEELDLLPGVRRRAGGRRVYGPDEVERLRFIQRLKTLGLTLAEIKDLNAVHRIQGSTGAMLERLDELLGRHLDEVDGRIGELMTVRDEIQKYRDHVSSRRATAPAAGTAKAGASR